MKLALIGHGGIATYAATQWQEDAGISVAAVICRRGREAAASEAISAAHGMPVPAVADAADLPDGIALAVDCGGHAALMAHGPALLRSGTDVVSVASGVLATPEHAEALDAAARQGGARLRFVSGAIGAVDAVAAAAVGGFFYSVGDAFELFGDLVIATSDEAFYRIDGVLGVDHSLSSSQKTDQTLVGFIERHYRRCRPTAFGVRNHGRPSAFHDRHNRVRCSKVYSYSFPHLKSPR